jgi:hypothetical protein
MVHKTISDKNVIDNLIKDLERLLRKLKQKKKKGEYSSAGGLEAMAKLGEESKETEEDIKSIGSGI